MSQLEKIKQDISNISSAFEMAGYLDGIRVCAIIFCKANYPDEVYKTKNDIYEITIDGFAKYLES